MLHSLRRYRSFTSAIDFCVRGGTGNSSFLACRSYSQEVHDHFHNPRNVGTLQKDDPSVGTAIVGKATCGDVIKLQVKVEDGIIKDAKFKTFGCGSAIASSSYATEIIKGKTCDEAVELKNTVIAKHLSLPPVKLHCSLLAEDAVRRAIFDFQAKQENRSVEEGNQIEDEGVLQGKVQ